jgi:hypothetical protein
MQTADPYNMKNVPQEELDKWTPAQRFRYWMGVQDRKKAREARKKVLKTSILPFSQSECRKIF